MTDIRPMTAADVPAVAAVPRAANEAAGRAAGRDPEPLTDDAAARFRAGMQRFIDRDPGGAWVAEDGDRVVGMAQAVRRDGFWGLSMLFVDPAAQSQGVGRRLLDAALTYADGATVRMILCSEDPRALRRYALAGLAVHPCVEAEGPIDRTAVPADLPGRSGDDADLDLVAAVDADLRGSRADDVAFLLGLGGRMEVVDAAGGRGYAVFRDDRLLLLGATDDATAAAVLWRFLAEAGDKAEVWALTAQQDWAVQVALAARIPVKPAGPLFVSGLAHPPGPWIPSGWYF